MLSASLKYARLDAQTNQECPAIVQCWIIDEINCTIEHVEPSLPAPEIPIEFAAINRVLSPRFCEKSQ